MKLSHNMATTSERTLIVLAIVSHSSFGRLLMRGIMRFCKGRSDWVLFEQMEPSIEISGAGQLAWEQLYPCLLRNCWAEYGGGIQSW